MDGSGRVVVTAAPDGGSRLVTLAQRPPVSLWPLPSQDGRVRLHMVGSGAGPLRGDHARLDVCVGPGAALAMTSAAASVALGGTPTRPSRVQIRAEVAPGGSLHWQPEPLIVTSAADHETSVELDLSEGSEAVWVEEVVLGRHDERPGRLRASFRADHNAKPLVRHDLVVGGHGPYDAPGVLGEARVVGITLLVGRSLPPAAHDATAAVLPCEGPAALVVATGDGLGEVRDRIAALVATPVAT